MNWKCLWIALSLTGLIPIEGAAQAVLEIWKIQGPGAASPYEGELVASIGNIVTATDAEGFFMQSSPGRSDNDPATSDGIYVYLGRPPDVSPGDSVSVRGTVAEQFGLTELNGVREVIRQGSAAALPSPIVLDDAFPGTDPGTPPPLERVEGMRVRLSGRATAPTNRFGEFALSTAAARPFREPGIPFPGQPGLPVWDGNPEVLWLDPDGAGADDYRLVATGDSVKATGVLTFRFGAYTFLPDSYQISAFSFKETSVNAPQESHFTLGSLNAFRMLRDEPGYSQRVEKLARYIVELLRAPDILALQEVGDRSTLLDLTTKIRELEPTVLYEPFPGEERGELRLCYLVRSRVEVLEVSPLLSDESFSRGGALFARPPLLLAARLPGGGPEIQVLNLHLRSLLNIEDPVEGPAVRQLRYEQSLALAREVESRREANLFVIGDFNAFSFSDGYVDVVNQIAGTPSLGALLPVQPIVSRPLDNLTDLAPSEERYSFINRGNAGLLDHCLASNLSGLRVASLQFARGNADAPHAFLDEPATPLRSSDHDGFVVYLSTLSVAAEHPPALPTVKLFPNPVQAGEQLLLETAAPGPVSIHLVSATGATTAEWFRDVTGLISIRLPAHLPKGFYFLRLITPGEEITLPIVINPR